jgi:uncharacterized protein (TIGR03000 family)
MSRRFVSRLATAALAVGLFIMATGPVLAQRGGHGGGHGGGFRNGFRGGFQNGFRGDFRRDGFRRDGFRGDFRRDGFRGDFRRDGFFPGFYGYGLGLGQGYASSGSAYGYVPNSTGYSGPVVSSYYSPPADAAPSAVVPASYGIDLADNAAYIRMKLPGDAEVWVEGIKTSQRGPVRSFVSPPLDPDKRSSYQVRARWTEDGRIVEQTRQVNLRANTWTTVDFTRPAPRPEMLTVPETR